MSSLSRADVAQWYLKAGHRRLWVLPLSAVLSIFVVFLVLRRMAEDPYANLLKSRAELGAYQKELPDERNAMVAISVTWKQRAVWSTTPNDNPIFHFNQDRSLLEQAKTETFWAACQPELKALKAALKIPEESSNFHPDKPVAAGPFFSLLNLRESANRLTLDAFMHAKNGNHAEAAESLKDVQVLARKVECDPSMVALMIAEAIRGIPDDDFWSWLLNERPPLDDAALKSYQASIDYNERIFSSLARAYAFERSYSLHMLDSVQVGAQKPFIPKAGGNMYSALMYGSDRDCMDQIYSEVIRELKSGRVPADGATLLSRHQRGPSVIARMMFPPFNRTFLAMTINLSARKLVYCALAVQRFQNKYKRDPKMLDELVPEFLTEVPKDFAGNPLKLRQGPYAAGTVTTFNQQADSAPRDMLMIYALGLNGKDDEGKGENSRRKGEDADDFSFLLRGLKLREQKP